MERDKRGRFIKKAQTGSLLENSNSIKIDPLDPYGLNARKKALDQHNLIDPDGSLPFKPVKIGYTLKNGKYYDETGAELSPLEVFYKPHQYQYIFSDLNNNVSSNTNGVDEESHGMNFSNPKTSNLDINKRFLDKNKLADFLEVTRAGIASSVNNKITKRALEAEKPFLQDVSESYRPIYGDYRSKTQGAQAAAQLRHLASKPITSDGALQQQMMLDAQIKGQDYINQGNAKDDAMIRQTSEVAWQQNKENQQQRQAAAMSNRQTMLTTEKNKSQIKNMNNSANYSQVIEPFLAGKEQTLRNKAVEQDYYKDYYNDALVSNNVWNTYESSDLSPSQKQLLSQYRAGTEADWNTYISSDATRLSDWSVVKKIMNNEIIRQKAALKNVYVNPQLAVNNNQFGSGANWFNYKKGGTIYKAKLTKRTKDNDRGAKSIESSRKIAARFLEKAIDSLYTYNDVELIAKPKNKKRKYQAGGGLPFVGFTPVFATSEKGAANTQKTEDKKGEDLTSKDILELLGDMDGLPSDIKIIENTLRNFTLQEQNDPLGVGSSSDIASKYISLISKIKIAKFNREEYEAAFNQVKANGGLHELAITSEGMLIGTNEKGDFKYFTPDQVNAEQHLSQGYQLMTNSNLLYERANNPTVAFNHKLTTFIQNGIGMEVITKQINDILQNLGKSKDSEEGFIHMGSNGQIKEGLKYLQKAAKEIGDSSITDNMSVSDYYQAGYLTEDQANQAQLALQYIWKALPTNAKSLLQVKGGSAKGAEALLQSLVFAKTSTETQFKTTPKKMAKTSSSGSGSSGNLDSLKLSPVQMMQVGYTDHMPITLQKGTVYATRVNAQVLPITDVNKKLLGITTLDEIAESTFGGALDMNNVTMGDQLIDPHALQNVQIDSTNLYVMNLPIDKNSPDGTIKPDLSWMKKIEAIDETIRNQGITDKDQINALYVEAGLPVLINDNGELNIQDYCKFGVLNGHALNSAFKDLDLLDNTVVEVQDEDQINNVLNIINSKRSEKDRVDFDSESWLDAIFNTDHDSVFEGTIYIPIRTNAFTGMISGGEYPDVETAMEVEALIQQKERTKGYVDPGLL